MSHSGGMSQLLKGIIIGVLLIMAIIGTMSLLDNNNSVPANMANDTVQPNIGNPVDIVAPSITLNPDVTKNTGNEQSSSNIGNLNAELSENTNTTKINKDVVDGNDITGSSVTGSFPNEETVDENVIIASEAKDNKPVLEGERTPEEAAAKDSNPVTYGMMEINTIDSSNNQSLKVNYTVFDQENVKVAESNNKSNASYRLPVGQYKIETTLTRIDDETKQIIPVLSKSRYMMVRTNSTSKQTFEMEPPAMTGVLQVSAKMNTQIVRADFIIQKANGEVIASRKNVTNSLFKLDSGTYKVSVSSGSNKDFKTVEVKAGESTQTVFILQQAAQQGKLLVRVFDTRSSNAIRADIVITSANGSIIEKLEAVTQAELSLVAGDYKISVTGPNGTSNKNIQVKSGQALSEVFRFDTPNNDIVTQNNSENNTTQINKNVTIKPVEAPVTTNNDQQNIDNKKVTLSVIAQDEQTGKPMKSNIYIQTPAGKHLDKKTYVDSASFTLSPGVYKVTVRAKNRNNIVKTIRIDENQNTSETFLLINPNKILPEKNITESATTSVKPLTSPNVIATGFLNVSMQAPRNQRVNKETLKTHFIVVNSSGKKIVELTSVSNANFKLDIGSYTVTAIHKNKRRSQRININQNQNTRLVFNSTDFQAPKGVLRSRIVDELGRPLKGNLSVSNMLGQIVARANGVSTGVFDLSPARHTISVNYQGLSGSEVVNINANETTVQTFTIAPNRNAQKNNNEQNGNDSRNIKDILKDKLKEEIQKQF